MEVQPGEMASGSSVRVFFCRRCSGLEIKQANSLNVILVANCKAERDSELFFA